MRVFQVFAAIAVVCLAVSTADAFHRSVKQVGTETVEVVESSAAYQDVTETKTVKVPVTIYVDKTVNVTKRVAVPQEVVKTVEKPVYARTKKTLVPYETTVKRPRIVWEDVPRTRYGVVEELVPFTRLRDKHAASCCEK